MNRTDGLAMLFRKSNFEEICGMVARHKQFVSSR